MTIEENNELTTEPIEINEGKFLYIGNELNEEQKKNLFSMVQEKSRCFTWDYLDMNDIHPNT